MLRSSGPADPCEASACGPASPSQPRHVLHPTIRRSYLSRNGCRNIPPRSTDRSVLTSAPTSERTNTASKTSRLPTPQRTVAGPPRGIPTAAKVLADLPDTSGRSGTVQPTARSWSVMSWRPRTRSCRRARAPVVASVVSWRRILDLLCTSLDGVTVFRQMWTPARSTLFSAAC